MGPPKGEGEPHFMCWGGRSGAARPGEEVVVLGEKGSSWPDPAAGVDGAADDDGFVFVFYGGLVGCD